MDKSKLIKKIKALLAGFHCISTEDAFGIASPMIGRDGVTVQFAEVFYPNHISASAYNHSNEFQGMKDDILYEDLDIDVLKNILEVINEIHEFQNYLES